MAASCKHSSLYSVLHGLTYRQMDARSPQTALTFRPGTKFALVLKKSSSAEQSVMIAAEGPTEGLTGAIWTHDEKGDDSLTLHDVQPNTNYSIPLTPNSHVYGILRLGSCPCCAQAATQQKAAHEKELQTLRSQNESFKQEKEKLAVEMVGLSLALEQHKQSVEAAAVEKSAMANEVEALRSKISELEQRAEESTRVSTASWAMRGADPPYVTDFRLVVDGVEIPVHRLNLALKSASFFELFQAEPCRTQLTIDRISQKTVERMLHFVYRGRLEGLEEDAPELYAAAQRFQIDSLLTECTNSLKASITADNAADLLVLAARQDDPPLAAFTLDFAEVNGGKLRLLIAAPVLRLLPKEMVVYEKIVCMLKDDSAAGGSSDEQSPPSDGDSQLPSTSQSSNDGGDDRPDSTSSSEFVRIDAAQ
ncbi:Speckle-type POZ protein A-like protein [Aphelenchoides fujianensis]|nr:Speckle-type POZ protein A-like protein [Aphelenchoides fujianensis]